MTNHDDASYIRGTCPSTVYRGIHMYTYISTLVYLLPSSQVTAVAAVFISAHAQKCTYPRHFEQKIRQTKRGLLVSRKGLVAVLRSGGNFF